MRDSQLLDNGSASTFPWQRTDAVSDELFELVINSRFAWNLQKRKLQSAPVQNDKEEGIRNG
jgi:hypothetical protein